MTCIDVSHTFLECKQFAHQHLQEFEKINFRCNAAKINSFLTIDKESFAFETLLQKSEENPNVYAKIPNVLDQQLQNLTSVCHSIIFDVKIVLHLEKESFAFFRIDFRRGDQSSQDLFQRWPLSEKQLKLVLES